MIKPAKCPRCENKGYLFSWKFSDGKRWLLACPNHSERDHLDVMRIDNAKTRLGAILRFDLWAWRERRKMRKESGK